MGRRYKSSSKTSSVKDNGKINIKPVIISSVIALLLGLLIVEAYYVLNSKIGGNLLHNNDNFTIHTLEDGDRVFPMEYTFKTADNKDLTINKAALGKEHIVINFFNSATENCLGIMKEIDELKEKLPNAYVVNINVGDDVPIIESYIKENHLKLSPSEVIVDLDMKMFKEFGYDGMPILTVIDYDGTVLGEIKNCYSATEIVNEYKGIVSSKDVTSENDKKYKEEKDDISAVLD